MKTLSMLAICIMIVITSIAADSKTDEGPQLRFEPTEINIGEVAVDDVTDDLGKVEITVHNDGNQPLIINRTTACCGTRVKEWPQQPIAPGESGTVKVEFRVAPRAHRISRTVTVQSNASNGQSQRVAILGEIVLQKDSGALDL